MWEFVKAGGWLMVPIIGCSALAMAIIAERFWTLRRSAVTPRKLLDQAWTWVNHRDLSAAHIDALRKSSPLGRVLAAALDNRHRDREVIKEGVEDVGRHVVHHLERYLNTLGTIAAISPLLGLLGTVIGMIQVFSAILAQGNVGNATSLAGGISQALITTAAGLTVAIPSYWFYRFFRGRIERLVVAMEEEAFRLIAVLDGSASPPQTEGRPRQVAGK